MKAKSFDFKLVVRTSFWNCKENAKKKGDPKKRRSVFATLLLLQK
jgi:hypothetical protein